MIDRLLGMFGLARGSVVDSKIESVVQARVAELLQASFDMNRTDHENKNHWAEANALSGRAVYFKSERKTARERSRYEAGNNSWYAGMLRTAANHIVGTGPRLQMRTSNPALNLRVERAWRKWSPAIGLAEKLRTAVETYWRDGEWFAMRAVRPSLYPITLDVRSYEADQVAQPYSHVLDPTIEDGKRVDNLGNAVEYWIYDHHPGDLNIGHFNVLSGQWYSAEDVIHLYRQDRPGQLRGFPRCAPAIDHLAHMRRFSKATLSAAEAAAMWSVFVKTTGSKIVARPSSEMASIDFERNKLQFLPEGWEPEQINPEHPATTNEMFQRTELMYFCRCSCMPYSLAAGTSKDSNFSSAKMDINNLWEPEVKSEQQKLSDVVMSTIFRWFLEDIAISTELLDDAGLLCDIDYAFFWPPLPKSDEVDQATAAQTRIAAGLSTIPAEYLRNGEDWQSALETGAAAFGVTVPELQAALFAKAYATSGQVPAPPPTQSERYDSESATASTINRATPSIQPVGAAA